MTQADKIRRFLAKGYSVSDIAKKLGVSKNQVHVLRWKDAQKAKQVHDIKAEAWRKRNRWFGRDEMKTAAALGYHETLVKAGVDPKSDEYWNKVDEKFGDEYWNKVDEKFGEKTKPNKKKPSKLENITILTAKEIDALIKPIPDLVNHPAHYTAGGIETIDFIEAKDLNYRLGNAVKYITRAGKKDSDPVQDLEKAAWYLKREIDARKGA